MLAGLAVLGMTAVVSGCGQKGALSLPKPAASATTQAAIPAATAASAALPASR